MTIRMVYDSSYEEEIDRAIENIREYKEPTVVYVVLETMPINGGFSTTVSKIYLNRGDALEHQTLSPLRWTVIKSVEIEKGSR